MKESAINEKVIQKLSEFETIQNIEPSAGWNESVTNKIFFAKPASTSYLPSKGFIIVILVIVLINIGSILNTFISNSNNITRKDKDMQLISKELLINPISINN